MQALQKKIEMNEQEQINQREIDLERLIKKYNNVKTELASQQKLEFGKSAQKLVARPGNASRFSPGRSKRVTMGAIEA